MFGYLDHSGVSATLVLTELHDEMLLQFFVPRQSDPWDYVVDLMRSLSSSAAAAAAAAFKTFS